MHKKTMILRRFILLIIVCLDFYGCKDWVYDVDEKGIHFERIYRSEKGPIIGYMQESLNIQGFPCEKGWIHFKKDWQLQSFQLSHEFLYQGTRLPAHTWLHFPCRDDMSGYICAFPYDYEVQGNLCRGSGGYKGTQTGFYSSGKLRSFFAPADITVDEVPCKGGLLANICLYENGRIKSCALSKEYRLNGKTYEKGQRIEFGPVSRPNGSQGS